MDFESGSGSVLSQLQHQIGELHTTESVNMHHIPETNFAVETEDSTEDSASEINLPATSTPAKTTALDLKNEELFPSLASPAGAKSSHVPAWRLPPTSAPKASVSKKPLLAGRVTERLEIPLNMQAKFPGHGKGSISDIVKQISLRTQSTIDISNNSTVFVITAKPDIVAQIRRDILQRISIHVTDTVLVPVSVRPHILGAGGKNLKALVAKTGTKINIPRLPEDVISSSSESIDEAHPVTITGDFEGVKMAKSEIEAVVAQRTSKLTVRVGIDRSYHPFIVGSVLESLEQETGARIHVPPLLLTSSDKNLNEILVVGNREGIKLAEERLIALYENLKRTTRTISFPVKKRQHRFIIGSKGATLQEILQTTGCSVELPSATDASDMITVRGPDNMLGSALQVVLQKANEVTIEEVHVDSLLPKGTDRGLFLRYLFTKERAELRKIESSYSVTIHQMQPIESSHVLEIQGKSKSDVDTAFAMTTNLIKEWGASLFFGEVEIPRGLHRYVIGKNGQNIAKMKSAQVWEGRLVDVVVPNESDDSDDVLLVVRRLSGGLGSAPNAKAPKTANAKANVDRDAEVQAFVAKVRDEILSVAKVQADFTTESVHVAAKYHGRLIGAGGDKLKELLHGYGTDVSVKFPTVPKSDEGAEAVGAKKTKESAGPDTVVVKGPKKAVAEVKAKIEALVADLKHIEVISSFTESVRVKKGLGKKLLQGAGAPFTNGSDRTFGNGIGWLIRSVRDAIASTPVPHGKLAAGDVTADQAILNLRVELEESKSVSEDDVLTVIGPKNAVAHAKKIIADRATRLADQTTIEAHLFDELSSEAKAILAECKTPDDLKRRVLRRLIGKEGKGVKATMEKHAVYIQFPNDKRKKNKKAGDDEPVEDEEPVDEASITPDGLVTIKGNSKDVVAAKKEILANVESDIIKSHSILFEIPKSVLPHVVGTQGSRIKIIKDEHNVRVDFNDISNDDGDLSIEVVLEGSRAGCLAAKKKILEITDELVNTDSIDVKVPSYLHKDIIGASGSRIKTVIESFGGQDKVKIQFPPRNETTVGGGAADIISIKAHKSELPKLKSALIALVNDVLTGDGENAEKQTFIDEDVDDCVVDTLNIPKSDLSRILGRGGENLKDIMRKFRVLVWLLDSDEEENVTLRFIARAGDDDKIYAAMEEVKGKLRMSTTVPIPARISTNLATLGHIHEAELACIQDILKKVRMESSGSAVAEISSLASKGKENSVITVRGDAKSVDAAVATVQKGLEELLKYESTGRILVNSDLRPHIIGRGGSTISRIRDETGASVEINRASGRTGSSGQDTIIIRGSNAAVEAARTALEKIIADQHARVEKDQAREAARAASAAAAAAAASSSSKAEPARIDDDKSNDAAGSPVTFIPGYAGRSQNSQKGGKVPAPAVTFIPSTSTSYYAASMAPPKQEEWQNVKKKGKKADEDVAEAAVPGAGEGKKKKKKKAKSQTADSETPKTDDVEASIEVPEIPPVKVTSTSPAKSKSSVTPSVMPASTPAAVPTPKAEVTQKPVAKVVPTDSVKAAVPAPRPASPVKPATVYLVPEVLKPVDDGWTTVKKSKAAKMGVADMIAVASEASGDAVPKKKKNKKKKKKTANAAIGAEETGVEVGDDDEGDE